MLGVDESKYSLDIDTDYSCKAIYTVILYSFIVGSFSIWYEPLNDYFLAHIPNSFLFWAVSIISLTLLILMKKVKRYPVFFSFGAITLLFIAFQIVGITNRAPILFLSIVPLFFTFYLYLIMSTDLENPNTPVKDIDLNRSLKEGSLSGTSGGGEGLRIAQIVIFSKTFLYACFLVSLVFVSIEII